jgi:hypothetical protein
MRWVRQMAGMGDKRRAYRVLVGRAYGNRPLEDLGVGEKTILKWTLEEEEACTGLIWLRTGGGLL